MKRILPALLVALAAFACACRPIPPTTNKGNVNGNANDSDRESLRTNNEQRVEIYLTNSNTPPRKCDIKVDPDKITLSSGKGKVRWVAYNDCDAAVSARLIIENFGKNNPDSSGHSPFGDESCDNRFAFDPIAKGEEGRLISKTGKKDGTYRYALKLIGTDGANLGTLDPEVQIGGFDVNQ